MADQNQKMDSKGGEQKMESKMQKLDLDMEEEGGLSMWQKIVGLLVVGAVVGAGGYLLFSDKKQAANVTENTGEMSEETGDTSADGESIKPVGDNGGEMTAVGSVSSTQPTETSSSVGASANVVVAENQSSGGSVLVKLASLAQDGWVVVHEDRDGKPGNVLGATYRTAGLYNNVTVRLLRGTTAGGTYYVMIHKDDGNKDDFSLKTDTDVMTSAGEPVMVTFKAQ